MKPRVHIIGGPGTGKSFAAGVLARSLGVTAYELDDIFWDRQAASYGMRADVVARDRELAQIVHQDGWIIEGAYYAWVGPSFDSADVIIALTPALWIRHLRVIRRFLLRKLGRIATKRETLADFGRLLRWAIATIPRC